MKRTGLILVAALALIFSACGDNGNGGGPECNNDVLETGEQCDTTQLGGESCEGLGYFTGELGCTDQCTFDESNCTNCGNDTKDEGEMCDGQDLDNKNCTDLDYDGGDLACNLDCTFNGNDCYACGNNVIERDEECDREQFGLKDCKTEGHDGGDLLCTDNCVIDDSQCYDCGGTDPCEAQLCSGRGSCRVTDCVAYCECDNGFTPGIGLTCLEDGTCGVMGEDCQVNADCCMGICFKLGMPTGYCTETGCQTDANCINTGTDGRDMCCIRWIDGYNRCMKTAAVGVSCGDHTGTCGTSCAGALYSACTNDHICIFWPQDDPTALCGSPCTTDADCNTCDDPGDPGAAFECVPIGTGDTYCFKKADPCNSTADCTDPEVCGVDLNADQTGFEGICRDDGGAATGTVCDSDPHVWDEYCTSGICFGKPGEVRHCSEWCQSDADCPIDMLCSRIDLCTDRTCTTVLPADLCYWMPGSHTDCVSNGDCPEHEVCTVNMAPPDGLLANRCTTEECDPVSPDCGDVGDDCSMGQPPCAGRLCMNNGADYWCSALCDANAQCPAGMYCGPTLEGTQVQGACFALSGSQTPCVTNADCAGAGEVCMPIHMVEGWQTLCITPLPTDPLCSMCTIDADCGGNSVCIASTANPGEFYCGLPCPVGDECPSGYTCADVGGAVDNCMPLDDSCMTD